MHFVVGKEKLLIGSAVSRTHSLLITHRNKHKSSSLTSWSKGESPEAQVLIELIYVRNYNLYYHIFFTVVKFGEMHLNI